MSSNNEIFVKKSLGFSSLRKGFSSVSDELLNVAMEWHFSKMKQSTQLEIISEYLSHLALRMENPSYDQHQPSASVSR